MPDTIEAEVLEIDGTPPPPRAAESGRQGSTWKALQGRVLRLDRRWWPLWVILGLVVFALVAVVGVVFAALLIVAKVLGAVLRFFAGAGSGRTGSGLSKPLR